MILSLCLTLVSLSIAQAEQPAAVKPVAPAAHAPVHPPAASTPPAVAKPAPIAKEPQNVEEERARLVGLRVNLLPLAAGFAIGKGGIYSLGTEVRIIDELSVGPNFAYAKLKSDDTTISTFSYGARVNWYMSGKAVGSGWYLSPFFTIVPLKLASSVSQSGNSVPVDAKYSASIVGGTVGYQWLFDFGMTMNIGLGAFHMNLPDTLTMSGSFNGIAVTKVFDIKKDLGSIPSLIPEIEIGLGFAF